ncbi:Oxygen-dependent coproporphyrinogen-III oxidase [Diplonema papillatum]|nr:Oxygen-dependent coproporphyrinogen-III oxidase [Diplonema papillatum]
MNDTQHNAAWAAGGALVGAAVVAACGRMGAAPAAGGGKPPAADAQQQQQQQRPQWKTGEIGLSARERRGIWRDFVRDVQDQITDQMATVDGKAAFVEDAWQKEAGRGEGRTRVISDGDVFENGGCNWSEVIGENLPPTILAKHPHLKGKKFYASGVSMVLHPRNPHIPTVHLNYRYFEAGDIDSDELEPGNVWWFGGGMDLTPYVLYDEDAKLFHQAVSDACAASGVPEVYLPLKKYADDYFRNKHRGESRGVGGSFFDYLDGNPQKLIYQGENKEVQQWFTDKNAYMPVMTWTQLYNFARNHANAFLPAYSAIIERRRRMPETEETRNWQLHRRGRYVEFNLVHDRGTLFGLQVGGRTESILMSLPALVRWSYMYKAKTPEQQRLIDVLEKPEDWLGLEKKL